MDRIETEQLLKKIPNYDRLAGEVVNGVHEGILKGGEPIRTLADIFHGVWLGHPLHAVLTDVVIGSWMFSALLDVIGLRNRSRDTENAADLLLGLGAAAAIPTALSGLADYSAISPRAQTTGATHAILNVTGLVINLASLVARRNGQRSQGIFLSSLSLGILTASAWLGGDLAYKYGISVNKSSHPRSPKDWIPVLAYADLPEQQPRRVNVKGTDVLLYRFDGAIYAIGAVCAHDGGPLDEGKFDGMCVECPWHNSIYDLRDGSVIHGPSTYTVPSYSTRIQDGQVELKLREAGQ
jgi:nitrite reductase/ring-hydroxylating ferredoxin subunit/uncharacterized membrane protein